METAIGKGIREKEKTLKKDKIIKRELTAVLSAGTLVDGNLLTTEMAVYCLSLKETKLNENESSYGICFVDTSTAHFHISCFDDDRYATKLQLIKVELSR